MEYKPKSERTEAMNDTYGIDEAKLEKAIEMLTQVMGPQEAEKIKKLTETNKNMKLNLSEKEMKTVKTVIENPEMLRTILSSRQAREVLSKYLNKL